MDLLIQSETFCQLNYPALLFCSFPCISPREIVGLTMAMWTKQLQVFEPMIRFDAIDVVKAHGQWLAKPLVDATSRALLFQYPIPNQTPPNMRAGYVAFG